MYRKLMVPLDGSPLAEGVLPHVTALARALGAELLLVRAVQAHVAPGQDEMAAQVAAVRAGEEYLARVAERLRSAGLSVTARVRYGAVPEALLEHAADQGVHLIAMCTHGRTGLLRLVMGSVAEQVVRRATVPVFLVRAVAP